ncbi:hypothetical protein [Salinibacterium sp. UTAS2018]|uniref:hypothetical protein n=1 Tax=Salinibacterium sp. UTAS2018 TaxID=2508880 RepID=UPI0011AEB6CF|nr:hypothetical protein [Salinibacterium sp. UTAS2018]
MRIMDSLETGTLNAARRMKALARNGYEQEDLGSVARDVAALWERSLKAADLNWTGKHLFAITQLIQAADWQGAASLDVIRQAANADKHDASPNHEYDELLSALNALGSSLDTLAEVTPGLLNELPATLRVRRLVCAVYEVFHAGETIYSFLAADETDSWRTADGLDEFQVENRHTSEIETQLAALSSYTLNPAGLDDLKKSLLESDSELWQIMRMDASYQQIHDILAPYQHKLPLLPGLHREDEEGNVVATIAQALIAGASPVVGPRSPVHITSVRAALLAVFAQVPSRLKPLRVDRCTPQEYRSLARNCVAFDDALGVMVTDRGVLLIRTGR